MTREVEGGYTTQDKGGIPMLVYIISVIVLVRMSDIDFHAP